MGYNEFIIIIYQKRIHVYKYYTGIIFKLTLIRSKLKQTKARKTQVNV